MATLKVYANNLSEIYELVIEADRIKDALKKLREGANANPLVEDEDITVIYGTPLDETDITNLLNNEDDYE